MSIVVTLAAVNLVVSVPALSVGRQNVTTAAPTWREGRKSALLFDPVRHRAAV